MNLPKHVPPYTDLRTNYCLRVILPTNHENRVIRFISCSIMLALFIVMHILKSWHWVWIVITGLLWMYLLYLDWYSISSRLFCFGRKVWLEPSVPHENKLEAHTLLRYHQNMMMARKAACIMDVHSEEMFKCTDKVQLLDSFYLNSKQVLESNEWQFQLFSSVEDALKKGVGKSLKSYLGPVENESDSSGSFSDSLLESSEWQSTVVPSNWTMISEVTDWPIYTNVTYPFPNAAPMIPKKNPTGVYRLPFLVNKTLHNEEGQSKKYNLIFHGVESCLIVYLNGHYVGMSKDSRLPSEFDVTQYISIYGNNVLECVVPRFCDGSYLEDQDHWWMAGIHRSVELVCSNDDACIQDYQVDAKANGELKALVKLNGLMAMTTYSVRCELYSDKQNNVLDSTFVEGKLIWSKLVDLITAEEGNVMFADTLENVSTWSSDMPNLYTLVITLFSGTEESFEIIQVESTRIGFRTAEMVPNVALTNNLLINGERVIMCGVNRHEHCPDNGKVVNISQMHQDCLILKQNNFNAVRCSHYPNHTNFYRLCDTLGLYVVDEANIETHGIQPMGRIMDDGAWRKAVHGRILQYILRDHNHTSIIALSLGNEAGRGENLRTVLPLIDEVTLKKFVVMYESGGKLVEGTGRTELTDVICPMYPPVQLTEELCTTADVKPGSVNDRPVILCEYSHAMGNSNGNLHLYWNLFWNLERSQGGFIWDMIDQGLRDLHKNHFNYGGDYGEAVHDAQFCINGLFSPDRVPHPAVSECKYLQQPLELKLNNTPRSGSDIEITVINRNMYFVDPFTLLKFKFIAKNEAGTVSTGDCKVTSQNTLKLSLGKAVEKVKWLDIQGCIVKDQSWAKAGHIIINEQFELIQNEVATISSIFGASNSIEREYDVLTTESTLTVVNIEDNAPTLTICTKTGQIINFCDVLTNIQTNYSRAATDNDRGGADLLMGFVLPKFVVDSYGMIFGDSLFSYVHHWRKIGLVPGALESRVMKINHEFIDGNVIITIQVRKLFKQKLIFEERITYTLLRSNELHIAVKVSPSKSKLRKIPTLPRVGLSIELNYPINVEESALSAKKDPISFCGRGPHENYIDRNSSAKQGVYTYELADHYIVPSECGNRTQVKWLNLSNQFVINKLCQEENDNDGFQFSINAANQKAIDDALHTSDLPENRIDTSDKVYINIDHKQMGVGGDCSWFPCVYEDFKINSTEEFRYEFVLTPLK